MSQTKESTSRIFTCKLFLVHSKNTETYGSENIPGVSSCEDVHPAPPPPLLPPRKLLVCGQSASNPSQTPKQVLSLQFGSLPIVSDADAGGVGIDCVKIATTDATPPWNNIRRRRLRPRHSSLLPSEFLIVA